MRRTNSINKALGAITVALTVSISGIVHAQDYPSRPVEVIHQFGPGGGTDLFVRAIATPFAEISGRNMVSISVQGGGGIPASTNFLQRPADGHSLMAIGPEQVINHVLGRMDIADLKPVARVQYDQGLFLVSPNSPFKTIDDLIEAARAAPGTLSTAVTGAAGFDDVLVGQWNLASGADLATVPFSASEAISNTLGGHVDVLFEEYGPVRGLIESGDLVPLVLFADERLPVLPDVPTAGELGYDVTLGRWRGFALQAEDSAEHAATLFDLVTRAADTDSYKKIEEDNALQFRSVLLGPDEFASFIEQEVEIYTTVLRELGYIN
jgi:putative tricarboxylic transport membrane protein